MTTVAQLIEYLQTLDQNATIKTAVGPQTVWDGTGAWWENLELPALNEDESENIIYDTEKSQLFFGRI
jgi:hypothetical protein